MTIIILAHSLLALVMAALFARLAFTHSADGATE